MFAPTAAYYLIYMRGLFLALDQRAKPSAFGRIKKWCQSERRQKPH